METWITCYERNLRKAVTEHAKDYSWPIERVPDVVARMKPAFADGSYSEKGLAIKWTCKELGIKHTRKAIADFIASH